MGGVVVGLDEEPWRFVTAPFVHDNLGYQFVALIAVGIFGSLLERRFGVPAMILVLPGRRRGRLRSRRGGRPARLFESSVFYTVLGANGAALGPAERLARRRPPRRAARATTASRPDRRVRDRGGPAGDAPRGGGGQPGGRA